MAATILLIEDDAAVARSLARALENSGYHVAHVSTGADARAEVERQAPDLILLDLMLPDTDGLVLTSALKAITTAPIIVCSARHQQADRVLSLKLGADDFVAKPFDLDELEARIEAVLRRSARARASPPQTVDQVRVGDLVISQARGTVALDGQAIHLTPTEYRLLVALASRPDEVLSRETLGQIVWGYQDLGTGHLIDVHLGRLRLKLRRASRSAPVIVTVRGRGYTIMAEPPAAGGQPSSPPARDPSGARSEPARG